MKGSPNRPGVVIVGASHAGVQAAHSLRQAGYRRSIVLASAESVLPYQRPPLSKARLKEPERGSAPLKPEAFFAAHDIELLRGHPAMALDLAARTVCVARRTFEYAVLVLATGARARRLPGPSLDNVHYLRDERDAQRLSAGLSDARRIVVIGGGYVGLEVAAAVAGTGRSVVVVEAGPELLGRSLPTRLARHIAARHRERGTEIRCETTVAAIRESGGRADGVVLEDDSFVGADLILAGIGSEPNVALARDAGLELSFGGVRVDCHLRASNPHVYAIGDCATFDCRFADGPVRLESVQNAVDQAKHIAASIAANAAADTAVESSPYGAVPWFWSDQLDMKIQMAGLLSDETEELYRGGGSAFSVLQLDGECLRAAFSVNAPADHVAARKLIDTGTRLDLAAVRDPGRKLKDCVAS